MKCALGRFCVSRQTSALCSDVGTVPFRHVLQVLLAMNSPTPPHKLTTQQPNPKEAREAREARAWEAKGAEVVNASGLSAEG